MKIPKRMNRYCPHCRKHTEHKVAQAKKRTRGTAHPLSKGGKKRAKMRGERAGAGNQGRYSHMLGKRTGRKQSKKTDFRYECTKCKKKHVQKSGTRAKRVQFKRT